MREILFRGKRKHSIDFSESDWVFGDLFTDDIAIYTKLQNLIEIISETAGQYTNKKDINGTKIFEYDIVKEGCNGLIGVVVWDDDLATYKLEGFGEDYTIQDAEIEWEIIGNKFDNPELLRTPQNDEVRYNGEV